MLTKEELEFLKGKVNTSLKNTEMVIRNLEQKQKEKTITDKQKNMLEAFRKSRRFKQNLIAKLEKLNVR